MCPARTPREDEPDSRVSDSLDELDLLVAMVSVEFPDGETWLKVQEDPRLLEARRRMTEPSWPFEDLTSSIWQELATSD